MIVLTEDLNNISKDSPILIYLHFSKSGDLPANEITTLKNLRKAGYQICLVINSNLANTRIIQGDFWDAQIIRRNVGWDLGGYRDAYFALTAVSEIQKTQIFFMNNSIIWFPEMIEEYFLQIRNHRTDILASSVSHQYKAHIQTFLLGGTSSEGINAIENWLSGIKNWRYKRTVVRLGELGTNKLFDSGLTISTLPNSETLLDSGLQKIQEDVFDDQEKYSRATLTRWRRNRALLMAGIPMNPSHDFWLELLESGFPGIKVDFIKNNPNDIPDYELAISKLLQSGYAYRDLTNLLLTNKSKSLVIKLRSTLKW